MKCFILGFGCLLALCLPVITQAQVDTAWVRTYNGPGNGDDGAVAMTVDGAGNVYVTGLCIGAGSGQDYLTIKYLPNGDTAWIRMYNGPGNGSDYAVAIALDGFGNVYVTGTSLGTTTNQDLATIKYSATGTELWVARSSAPNPEIACDIAVDAAGFVYVGGTYIQSSSSYAYLVIKYGPPGNQLWPSIAGYGTMCWARGIAVNGSGDVYIGGWMVTPMTGGPDFVTVKFNASGAQQWLQYYNGNPNSGDTAYAFCMDPSENVWVGGRSYGGPVNLGDYRVVGFDPSANILSPSGYNGPGNGEDCVMDMVFDGSGNLFYTGRSVGSGSGQDYATLGNIFPPQRYNGPANGDDCARSIAVDDSGNVYVTGSSVGVGSGKDYLTIKYRLNGDTAWTARYNGLGNGDDIPAAIAVDDSGNVYVTGSCTGIGSGRDIVTIKYRQSPACVYLPGDINSDDLRLGGDVTYGVRFFKGAGTSPRDSCYMDSTSNYLYVAGDCNGDCQFRGADITRLVAYFKGTAALSYCHFFPPPPLREDRPLLISKD